MCDDLNAMYRVDAAHTVATVWLTGQPIPVEKYGGGTPREVRELLESLHTLPVSAQPARVAELRDMTCTS